MSLSASARSCALAPERSANRRDPSSRNFANCSADAVYIRSRARATLSSLRVVMLMKLRGEAENGSATNLARGDRAGGRNPVGAYGDGGRLPLHHPDLRPACPVGG